MTLGEYSYSLLLDKSVILIGLSDISPLKQAERLVKRDGVHGDELLTYLNDAVSIQC